MRFEKVSKKQFVEAAVKTGRYTEESAEFAYENIKLPKRATVGSAGYDFFSPEPITLNPGETLLIPTGIRAFIDEGYFLMLAPRSGLGFKYRLQLDNTLGIIDFDYVYSDNEGHIMAKITNDSKTDKTLTLTQGSAFIQGIFVKYGITDDDDTDGIRNGGFGSTSTT